MRVLLRRHGDGIGDWLLMLEAMKNATLQHPELELYVDFNLAPRGRVPRILSPIVRQAYECSDVVWKPSTHSDGYDFTIPHVVYERLGYERYSAGMLRCIGEAIGVDFVCDELVRPQYAITPGPVLGGAYAVVVSQSKPETSYKNWGIERFELAAAALKGATGCELVQVGAMGDYLLQGSPFAARVMGAPFGELLRTLAGARVIVCLENCIAVLAQQLRRPCVCIYADTPRDRLRDDAPRAVGRLEGLEFFPNVMPSIADVVTLAERFLR